MSPFLELIKPLNVLISYAIPFALFGVPLLWRHLRHKPATRREIKRAAWTIFLAGCWILFGNLFFDAYQQGTFSLPEAIVLQVVLVAIVFGGFHLVERRCPEENAA